MARLDDEAGRSLLWYTIRTPSALTPAVGAITWVTVLVVPETTLAVT